MYSHMQHRRMSGNNTYILISPACRAGFLGHMYKVIVGLSKSFSKRHNAETCLEHNEYIFSKARGVKDLPFTFLV